MNINTKLEPIRIPVLVEKRPIVKNTQIYGKKKEVQYTIRRLIKSLDEKSTPLEAKVQDAFLEIDKISDLRTKLAELYFIKAQEFNVDGKFVIVIVVPFRQCESYRKLNLRLVTEFEKRLNGKTVIILTDRKMLNKPKRGKKMTEKQKRPRSRTLTSVYENMLEDIVYPARIVGKRIRISTDCSKLYKIHLDEGKRSYSEPRAWAYKHVYQCLTGRKMEIQFPHVLGAFKVKDLRKKNKVDLLKQLNTLKIELSELIMQKTSSSSANKLSLISVLRKRVAKVSTVIHQTQKVNAVKFYESKKFKPLDIRPKLTRAKRRELTKKQKNAKTSKELAKLRKFPKRNKSFTKLLYHFPGEDTPYLKKIYINCEEITLNDVIACLELKTPHSYYFKAQDEEEFVKEEICDKNAIVPNINGRIICYVIEKDEQKLKLSISKNNCIPSPIKYEDDTIIARANSTYKNEYYNQNYPNSEGSSVYSQNMTYNSQNGRYYGNNRTNTSMSSRSMITDSNCSLNVIRVVLDMDKYSFLGISIVGQSNDHKDGGIYVGSIMKGGAVALDGRIDPGDMILDVNNIDLENMSNEQAVDCCWNTNDVESLNGTLQDYNQPPVQNVTNGLDPTSWVAKTTAMKRPYDDTRSQISCSTLSSCMDVNCNFYVKNNGDLIVHRSNDNNTMMNRLNLTINSDMSTIIQKMSQPNSGLEICDRTWLKLKINNSFIGSDLVNWLHRNIDGFADRRDAKKYAANLLKHGYIQHTANKGSFSEQCYYTISDLHSGDTSTITMDNYDQESVLNVSPPSLNKHMLSWRNTNIPDCASSKCNDSSSHYKSEKYDPLYGRKLSSFNSNSNFSQNSYKNYHNIVCNANQNFDKMSYKDEKIEYINNSVNKLTMNKTLSFRNDPNRYYPGFVKKDSNSGIINESNGDKPTYETPATTLTRLRPDDNYVTSFKLAMGNGVMNQKENKFIILSKERLKMSGKTSALMSGFAMIALVELNIPKDVSPKLVFLYAVTITLLISVNILSHVFSICILPHVLSDNSNSKHCVTRRFHILIEISWILSAIVGFLLFIFHIILLIWIRFYPSNFSATIVCTIIMFLVNILIISFAIIFYKKLAISRQQHNFETLQQLETIESILQEK
ncbi:40S ribosomal protein S7 [Intoshia linei]|uniref:Small ribosomal subunit protein eS7 n=1 Tax=Intoshia linei TaxID=1819745 RepID=A0A177B6I6_9BILA|nr:40S ribosomal protein S7 [Intoshia linei]